MADENSWEPGLRKRNKPHVLQSSIQTGAEELPPSPPPTFKLEQLPPCTLAVVTSHLPFKDLNNIGMVSTKLNKAQRRTRFARKRINVELLRHLFPGEIPLPTPPDAAVGVLQVVRPLRCHLRSSPSKNIREVDLSEFSSFRSSHFADLLRSINNDREVFEGVERLNVWKCVIELQDMAFLAQLMPKVWLIRCSVQSLVVPRDGGVERQQKMKLSEEQMHCLRAMVENFDLVSRKCDKEQLWFVGQLAGMFPDLEVVQLKVD